MHSQRDYKIIHRGIVKVLSNVIIFCISVKAVLNLIPKGCYFASADLKDAYYNISIHGDFQKYFEMYREEYFTNL